MAFSNRLGRYIFHPVIENSTFFVLCDQLGRNLFLLIAGNSTYFEILSRSGRNLPSTGYEDFSPFGIFQPIRKKIDSSHYGNLYHFSTFKSLGVEKHLSRVTKISTIFLLPSQLGRNLQCNHSDFYIFLKRLSQYFFTRFLSARKSSEHSKYVILS